MFRTVGVLRDNDFPCCPLAVVRWSVKARAGKWQLAQLVLLLPERRGSKKSCFPSVTLAAVVGLSLGVGTERGRWAKRGLREVVSGSRPCAVGDISWLEKQLQATRMRQGQRRRGR